MVLLLLVLVAPPRLSLHAPPVSAQTLPDQDMNGVPDSADPRTYDFESDTLGARPAQMRQLGLIDTTFSVASISGDQGVSYNATLTGTQDRFERLPAGLQFQDTTVYLDYQELSETCSVELWSEGTFGLWVGAGLVFKIDSYNRLILHERRRNDYVTTTGPLAPVGGRLRLRLIKGAANTSTLHVDSWNGSGFVDDYTVFQIPDDHVFRGRWTTLANHAGGRRAVTRVTVVHTAPPDALTLATDPEWSCDWKLFQRDAQDRATIPVRFFYRIEGTGRVQARVVSSVTGATLPGHDWTNHEATLSTANGASGSLDVTGVPVGGNYDVQVRLVRDSDGAILGERSLSQVAVGDVYLAGGQSNMSGISFTLEDAETPLDEVHLFHNDGTWKRASEPMDDGTDQTEAISFDMPQHSLMLRFAKDVYRSTGVPVGIIPGPRGGANLYNDWLRSEWDHANRGSLYGSLLHRARLQSYQSPPKGLLWFQGENDAWGRTTADYKADLKKLIAHYRQDLNNPNLYVLVAQLGPYLFASPYHWLSIQEAQRQVTEEDPSTALITTLDQPLADSIHFSVQGYKTIGARFAEAARRLVYGDSLKPLVRLKGISQIPGKRVVQLTFDGNVTGGEASLFSVADEMGTVPVTSATASGQVVSLVIGRYLSGTPRVTYGAPNSPNHPWVKDTRGTPVAFFQNVRVCCDVTYDLRGKSPTPPRPFKKPVPRQLRARVLQLSR